MRTFALNAWQTCCGVVCGSLVVVVIEVQHLGRAGFGEVAVRELADNAVEGAVMRECEAPQEHP